MSVSVTESCGISQSDPKELIGFNRGQTLCVRVVSECECVCVCVCFLCVFVSMCLCV